MGLGDELMCLGRLEAAFEETGFPHSVVCAVGIKRDHPAWHGNPAYDKKSAKSIVDGGGYRPYIRHWNGNQAIFNKDHRPRAGKIILSNDEKSSFSEELNMFPSGFVVIAPHLKDSASKNKSWGFEDFQSVVRSISIPCVQLLENENQERLEGAMHLICPTFKHAAGVIARSKVVVCNEGGTHHMAASMGVPAVVIFGSFIPPEVTGYPTHANLTTVGAHYCGKWDNCADCQAAMKSIKSETIIKIINNFLNGETNDWARIYRV